MSDRQQLAEHGTNFCIAALGIIAGGVTLGTALLPVAVLTMIGYEKWEACDRATVRRAQKAALDALSASPDITDSDIRVAAFNLRQNKSRIKFEPERMSAAVASGDLESALLLDMFQSDLKDLDPGPRRAITVTLKSVFDVFRQHPKYRDVFTQAMVMDLLRERNIEHTLLHDIKAGVSDLKEMIAAMQVQLQKDRPNLSPNAQILLENEPFIVQLANRYAEGSPDDLEQALRGLERALEVAAEIKQRGSLPSNSGEAVTLVMRRVAELNEAGRFAEAAQTLDDALEAELAEEERRAAEIEILIRERIDQAILMRDVEKAARLVVRQVERDTPVPAQLFEALRDAQDEWYVRGRDRGLAFDLEVSIAAAKICLDRAIGADERGAALNDLGNALRTLGARESGTARLEEAVAANRAALEEYTRERVPLDWASTQNNLGNALQTLGARESGTARLEEAVVAYRAALEERTRERVPLDWASTQNNLGGALGTLGERESGTARLEEAVAAYHVALDERTRERVPLDWAATQNNLGSALESLGERESGTARLQEAVAAYRAALEERTRERVPLDWATTQNNLGGALLSLWARETGTARLEEAVAAYRAALEERTRERVPLDWASTQNNLGGALGTLGVRESGTAHLEEAVAAYRAAMEERSRERVPLDWAATTENLGLVYEALFDKTGERAQLKEAIALMRAAREVWDETGALFYIEISDQNLARLEAKL